MATNGARFEGRVAIVTGAGNGLGRAYAEGFAAEGAAVVVADTDGAAARETVDAIEATGGRALATVTDVADERAVAAMVKETLGAFGGIDVLVNNAGLHMGRYNECTSLPADEWRRIFDVNVLAAVLCARECRAALARSEHAVILNQASMAAYGAIGAYGVTKLALMGVTTALATELAPDEVRVVAVAPGMFASDAVIERLEDVHKEMVLGGQLIKRFGRPADLVPLVLWLCSDEAAFVTAETFVIDGGYTRRY